MGTAIGLSSGISGGGKTPQKKVMPTPSASLEDKIYQYVGATDANYTNGYFYKCVSDGAATPTYSWSRINVQPSGSAASGAVVYDEQQSLTNEQKSQARSNIGAMENKTIDSTPTAGSANLVTSGGVKTALDAKQDTINDLSTIRSGAGAGATAVQPSALSSYRTSADQDTIDAGKASKASNPIAGHIATLDANGNPTDGGKTTADLVDIIYGYMHNSTFYLTRTGSAGSYVYSDAVTPVSDKQYTDKEGNVPYIWDGAAYQAIGGGGSEPTTEVVTFNISSSDGQLTLQGMQLTVNVSGASEPTVLTLDANGQASISIPVDNTYTVSYPVAAGYNRPISGTYVAVNSSRTISKSYILIDIANSTRSVVLEESSSPIWTLGGNANVIDNILGTYGSYVIDELHKKYARLDPSDHSRFLDGTAWAGTYGNAFRRLPKVYFMVKNDGNNHPNLYITLNAAAVEDETKFWPETWIGTYKGSVANNKLWSRPNVNTTQNMTMAAFWQKAQEQSQDYGLVNYFDHCMLNALHLCKFGKANSELTMGPGLQDAGNAYFTHQTGATASLGDGTGSAPYLSTIYTMNKLFGIEDLAGSTWEFRPNIRFVGNNAIVYEGNIVSNSAEGIRTFTRNESLSQAYIKNMILGPYFDMMPQTAGGSSSTYWCDGAWASSSGELLNVGGNSNIGSLCGLSASISYFAFSNSNAEVGGRLAFRGDISQYELVSGATLAALN